jgi:hypothetical protein
VQVKVIIQAARACVRVGAKKITEGGNARVTARAKENTQEWDQFSVKVEICQVTMHLKGS